MKIIMIIKMKKIFMMRNLMKSLSFKHEQKKILNTKLMNLTMKILKIFLLEKAYKIKKLSLLHKKKKNLMKE